MTVRQLAIFLGIASVCLANLASRADEPAKTEGGSPVPESGENEDADRKRRGEFLKAELDQYNVVAAERPDRRLAATDKPVLRYTNPVRTSFTDGAVFLWLEGERPLAAAVVSIRDSRKVVRELVSFTERPLTCTRDGRPAWTPKGGNLVDQPHADAPAPDKNDKRRLRQMRDISRRFRVVKGGVELRLMTQPIYRYASESKGVLDGAVFAFVEATDPDFFLVIEAHPGGVAGPAEWRYTLARMRSTVVEVELDGKPLWAGEGYWDNPRSISDPYVELPFGTYPPPAEKAQSP